METTLQLEMLPQPDDTTCGPTCLHALYRYYGDQAPLAQVVDEVHALEGGGTLAVFLANHALRRGYRARIYNYDLKLLDPTWFALPAAEIAEKLRQQMFFKSKPKVHLASHAFIEFLERGGELRLEDLTAALIRKHLKRGEPILTGLSSTFLYRSAREFGPDDEPDDVRGEPAGHFVVLCGYDPEQRQVLVADPFRPNPVSAEPHYSVGIDRVLCAVLLGVLTYDANLLVVQPHPRSRRGRGASAGGS